MKKNLIQVLTIVLVIAIMMPYIGFSDGIMFNDILDSYANKEIEALFQDGILTGIGEGKFNPKGKVDRAQLSTVLVRSLKLEQDIENAKKFIDVPQNKWYAGYVGALAKTGIAVGTPKNTFSPHTNVTKQELAVFYIRALGLEEQAKELKIDPNFSDGNKVASWAKDYVGLASHIGLISSISNDNGTFRFEPTIEVNREFLAHITYKLNKYKDLYHSILSVDRDVTKPVVSLKLDSENSTKTIKSVEPPVENNNIKFTNMIGKKMEFMGAYLMSLEFDVVGNIGSKVVKLVVNEGKNNEISIKSKEPKDYDFYFDGMLMEIDTLTIYIGNEKIDITNEINWRE